MKLLIASRFRTCEYLPVLALKWVSCFIILEILNCNHIQNFQSLNWQVQLCN